MVGNTGWESKASQVSQRIPRIQLLPWGLLRTGAVSSLQRHREEKAFLIHSSSTVRQRSWVNK